MRFSDREQAGQLLVSRLTAYREKKPIILALPPGGVAVGAEIARELNAPLEVLLARRLPVPGQAELAFGAMAETGALHLNREVIWMMHLRQEVVERTAVAEIRELQRQALLFRACRPLPALEGRTIILVDDGLSPGGTVQVALQAVHEQRPAELVLAVPAASSTTLAILKGLADRVVCLEELKRFRNAGAVYRAFQPISEEDVVRLLQAHRAVEPSEQRQRPQEASQQYRASRNAEREVMLALPDVNLRGTMCLPAEAVGLVLFAQSGLSDSWNRTVAGQLQRAGLGTLVFDLLSEEEAVLDQRYASFRYDLALLTNRVASATDWVRAHLPPHLLRLGYFGEGTGSGAALIAAARRPALVGAVVSSGGRPDLAGTVLRYLRAPTLLIVGGDDELVLQLNQAALDQMTCDRELTMVPHATHLFEEPGALEEVGRLAADWFRLQLAPRPEQIATA